MADQDFFEDNDTGNKVSINVDTLSANRVWTVFDENLDFSNIGQLQKDQVWTGIHRSSVQDNGSVSGVVTFDADASAPLKRKWTVTGDITSFTVTNGTEGQESVLYFYQDGTGGRTIVFSGIDGTAPTINTGANEITTVHIERYATSWRFVE